MQHKGRFKPKNYKKYKGDSTKIFYRSSWERNFMIYCDKSPAILEWNSEEIVIPYISPLDKRVHRYFPDFFIKYKSVTGTIVREVIEVKPKRQTMPPKPQQRKTKKYLNEITTYAVNEAKFKAAEQYCKDRKFKFRIFIISPMANAGIIEIATNLKLFENSFLRLSELFLYKYVIKANSDEK